MMNFRGYTNPIAPDLTLELISALYPTKLFRQNTYEYFKKSWTIHIHPIHANLLCPSCICLLYLIHEVYKTNKSNIWTDNIV